MKAHVERVISLWDLLIFASREVQPIERKNVRREDRRRKRRPLKL